MAPDVGDISSSPIIIPPQPQVSDTTSPTQVRPGTVQGQTIPRSPRDVQSVGGQQLTEPPTLSAMDADDEITVARDIMADLAEGPDEAEAPKAGLLKRFFQAAGRIIKSIFTRPNSEPRFHDLPENIKLQHPSGREITLSSKALPPIPLGTSLEDFTAGIQDKINRDGELVNTILDGDIDDRQCGPKEMTDIMWFMHTATETKVGET